MSRLSIDTSLTAKLLLAALVLAGLAASPALRWDLAGPLPWPNVLRLPTRDAVHYRTAPSETGQPSAWQAELALGVPLA
jgi:hypothetical protein